MALSETLAAYKRDGFAIIRGFIPPRVVQQLRGIVDPALDELGVEGASLGGMDSWGEGRFADLGGRLFREYFVQRPELLDFVELLMGPFVGLDTLQVIGRSAPLAEGSHSMEYVAQGKQEHPPLVGWHRDAFTLSQTWSPPGETTPFRNQRGGVKPYTAPSAVNCLVYLQDLSDGANGSFRVIPGSHLDFTPTPLQPGPAPGEVHPRMHAGDLLVLHCDVLHGALEGLNPERERRIHISSYLCRMGLPHRDRYNCAVYERASAEARERGDLRVLRLLGGDPGFQRREEEAWAWLLERERRGENGAAL